MNNLVIGIFSDELQAEETRRDLLAKAKSESLDVEDALILKKGDDGKLEFRHMKHHTTIGAVVGAFWGMTLGILFLNPLFALAGLAAGSVLGGLSGSLSHVGVDTGFVRNQAGSMPPGSYAVCVLVRENAGGVLNEMEALKESLLQTRLCTQKGNLRQCSILPLRASSVASRV